MAEGKFIAYYRVSTSQQGQSGLGLEAQRKAVADHLNGGSWKLIEEFTEVETGKGSNALARRPQLAAALAACRKQRAVLVIAKLDRLARNVAFIANLMEARVKFVAVDMPTANEFTVHILAAVAQEETRRIAERTKVALAAAKARGTVLGKHGREVLSRENRRQALERARDLAGVVADLRLRGMTSVRALAAGLNDRKVATPRGGKWHGTSVHRLIKRIDGAG
jgi:DNA invertase Pin-like site-specific DNA recombinase